METNKQPTIAERILTYLAKPEMARYLTSGQISWMARESKQAIERASDKTGDMLRDNDVVAYGRIVYEVSSVVVYCAKTDEPKATVQMLIVQKVIGMISSALAETSSTCQISNELKRRQAIIFTDAASKLIQGQWS